MTTFSNLRLPDELSYGSQGGVQFSTEVMQTHSGAEYRAPKWEYPVSKYNVAPAISTPTHVKELHAFFRIHKGRAIGFRFKDFMDYSQKNQIIGSGDGKTRTFELFKTYWHGTTQIKRRIYKPVRDTVYAYINKRRVAAEVDYDIGTITLSRIPNKDSIVSASFEFDIPVRFDTDFLEITADISKIGAFDIPVIEIKNIADREEAPNGTKK